MYSSKSNVPGIVIIGAGECGIRAAFTTRDSGYQGSITVIGEEISLPYERPPLSKPDDSGAVKKLITTLEALSEKEIVLKRGVSAVSIKRDVQEVVLSDSGSLPYEKLLLATGSRPRPLNCPGGERALLLRTIEDANAIYSAAQTATHVVIVGAGLIGLELAAELKIRGLQVTILEAGPRPLGRNVPELLATKMVLRHEDAGVGIVCNAQIASCTESAVVLNDGRIFEADLIIAAIGVVPNTELAASAGLNTENGIRVDCRLATDDLHILAAGDCAAVKHEEGTYRRYETWQNAQAQGEVAGHNLAGGNVCFGTPIWFWSNQYELGLQCVGNTSGTPVAIRSLECGAEIHFFFDAKGALVGAAGLGRGNAVAKDIKIAQKLLGMHLDAAALSDPEQNLKKLLRAA